MVWTIQIEPPHYSYTALLKESKNAGIRCHSQEFWGTYTTLAHCLQLWVAAFKTCSLTLLYLPLDKAQTEHLLCYPEQRLQRSRVKSCEIITLNSLNKLPIELTALFLSRENTHLSNLLGSQTATSYYSYSETIKYWFE